MRIDKCGLAQVRKQARVICTRDLTASQAAEPRFSGYEVQAFPSLLPTSSPLLLIHQRSPALQRVSQSHSRQAAFFQEAQGFFCPGCDYDASKKKNHQVAENTHQPHTKYPSYFVQGMLMWQNNPSNNVEFSTSGKIHESHTITESVSDYLESRTKQPLYP